MNNNRTTTLKTGGGGGGGGGASTNFTGQIFTLDSAVVEHIFA